MAKFQQKQIESRKSICRNKVCIKTSVTNQNCEKLFLGKIHKVLHLLQNKDIIVSINVFERFFIFEAHIVYHCLNFLLGYQFYNKCININIHRLIDKQAFFINASISHLSQKRICLRSHNYYVYIFILYECRLKSVF